MLISTLAESTSVVVRQAIVVFLASVVICCCIPHRDHEVPAKETRSKKVSGGKEIGHILLIHGSAPFNRDGQLPIKGKGIYSKIAFFKKIADELEKKGWRVVRYSKFGVYHDRVNFDEYKKTDLTQIMAQLRAIWSKVPKTGPRIVFGWSEGTLHATLLDKSQMDAIILLGGISTNIKDILREQLGREGKKTDRK